MKPGVYTCPLCASTAVAFEPHENNLWWCFECASGGFVAEDELTVQIANEPWQPIHRATDR